MSFKNLLPHTCEITLPGEITGTDDWGRPIHETKKPYKTSCRYVTEKAKRRNTKGESIVIQTSLLLPKECELSSEMSIDNLCDAEGYKITDEPLVVDNIKRQTGAKKLHHYKVVLKGAE